MLKDHFSPEDGDIRLIHLKEVNDRVQLEKQIKQRQFLRKEQKRARLFNHIVAEISAECLEQFSPSPTMERNRSDTVQDETRSGGQRGMINPSYDNNGIQGRTLIPDSISLVEATAEELVLHPEYTCPPCSPLPLSSDATCRSTSSTGFTRRFDEEKVANSARSLELYSYPYFVANARKVATAKTERETIRVRPQIGRRVFARLERQRVRAKCQILEDTVISERIKESAETDFLSKTGQTVNSSELNHEFISKSSLQSEPECNTVVQLSTVAGLHHEEEDPPTPETDESSILNEEILKKWRDLMRQMKVPLPTLCLCSRYIRSTATMPPWLNCADNCPYFHRPEAYLKSLLDYIHSMD
ncbi:hypothetical protein CRM22_004163 [Opisthorchis felineus]|uniref:Uncharacterized protein n=1 Tax=Opisthorchis felineus TaxID=147828 RepID=A0A4S2LYB4_OPIFE|nr:hypothetical protein CRM22_004163 [Opisthorchis felineus]